MLECRNSRLCTILGDGTIRAFSKVWSMTAHLVLFLLNNVKLKEKGKKKKGGKYAQNTGEANDWRFDLFSTQSNTRTPPLSDSVSAWNIEQLKQKKLQVSYIINVSVHFIIESLTRSAWFTAVTDIQLRRLLLLSCSLILGIGSGRRVLLFCFLLAELESCEVRSKHWGALSETSASVAPSVLINHFSWNDEEQAAGRMLKSSKGEDVCFLSLF